MSTTSEVFCIFTTPLYQYFSGFFLFALFGDEPEVLLPKYSQTAILNAPHFRWVVKGCFYFMVDFISCSHVILHVPFKDLSLCLRRIFL